MMPVTPSGMRSGYASRARYDGAMLERKDIEAALASLAKDRPVFHSEADFQFALAWELQRLHLDLGIRLEYPVPLSDQSGEVDIWLRDAKGVPKIEAAIELKYWKRKADLNVDGERFSLKERAFKNLYPYDFWKDVARIEALVAEGSAATGFAITLTNDQYYWNAAGGGTADEAFRMHEGRAVNGTLSWGQASDWNKDPLVLGGSYRTHWQDYSAPAPDPSGNFRYLLLDVGAGLAEANQ